MINKRKPRNRRRANKAAREYRKLPDVKERQKTHTKNYDASKRPAARNLKRRENNALRYAKMLTDVTGTEHHVVQYRDENGEIAFQAIPDGTQMPVPMPGAKTV